MKLRIALLSFVALFAMPVSAATILYEGTINLDPSMLGANARPFSAALPGSNFNFGPGDVLDATIKFAPGQRLQIANNTGAFFTNSEWIHATFGGPGGSTLNHISLLDVSGEYLVSNPYLNGFGGIVGAQVADNLTNSAFSFSGMRILMTFNGPTTVVADPGEFAVNAGNVSIINSVPEPTTWATMLLGLSVIGGAMRYRRRPKVVVRYA